jgi:hypothetical protein
MSYRVPCTEPFVSASSVCKTSLYSSSCSHVAAFPLVLAQNLLHLIDQNSTTCTLVANLMEYLELHLLCAIIAAIEGVLELTKSH